MPHIRERKLPDDDGQPAPSGSKAPAEVRVPADEGAEREPPPADEPADGATTDPSA